MIRWLLGQCDEWGSWGFAILGFCIAGCHGIGDSMGLGFHGVGIGIGLGSEMFHVPVLEYTYTWAVDGVPPPSALRRKECRDEPKPVHVN